MKTILRILKWLLLSILGIALLLVLFVALDNDAQEVVFTEADSAAIGAQPVLSPLVDSTRYKELLQTYGHNKKLLEGYEYQCLLALSYYPELKDVRIDFVYQPAFLPLASRPDPITVLFPFIKRKILVVISSESEDFFEDILIYNLPFNEQVGVIGHELAHAVYYMDKNSFELGIVAYKYLNDNDYRIQFERDTDIRAIAHGLGYQMYDYAFFVRKSFGDSKEEIEAEEGDMYLSPREIAREMAKYSFYQDTIRHADTYFP